MEDGLSVCVGGDCWEMTAQLMEWNGAALMKEGGKGGGEECKVKETCVGRL